MSQQPSWQTSRFDIDLSRPRVMGIVNVTPDSFSDGGRYCDMHAAIAHCETLLKDGAHILDIGGESSRPGAHPLPLDEELRRVLPVVTHAVTLGVPISVDTYKPEVMRAALDLGADIINDIQALRKPGALDVAAAHPSCGICLMHMQGQPVDMQCEVRPGSVVSEVFGFLAERLEALGARSVDRKRIVLDPGIGFGKSVEQNFELLRRQAEFLKLGQPILSGGPRKPSLGAATGRPANERGAASVAAALAAVQLGARILRVHDVAETVDALTVWNHAGLSAAA